MRSFSKDHLTSRLRKLHQGLRHAFAAHPVAMAFSQEDLELMERIADVLVNRSMGTPASIFLESMGPMNFLGSQALHFLTPIIECAVESRDIERVAALLERRETIPRLVALIETKMSMQRASAQ